MYLIPFREDGIHSLSKCEMQQFLIRKHDTKSQLINCCLRLRGICSDHEHIAILGSRALFQRIELKRCGGGRFHYEVAAQRCLPFSTRKCRQSKRLGHQCCPRPCNCLRFNSRSRAYKSSCTRIVDRSFHETPNVYQHQPDAKREGLPYLLSRWAQAHREPGATAPLHRG